MLGDPSLAVLSAMITPAVLISACGALILSTSTRLGRAVDRVRSLTARVRALAHDARDEEYAQEERRVIVAQMPRLMRRVRLLQRSLTAFYSAVALFVLTSVVIGASAVGGLRTGEVPIVFGLLGASVLCYGALLLILEARLSLETTLLEMAFLREIGDRYAEGHPPG